MFNFDVEAFSIQSAFSPANVFTDVGDLVTTILTALMAFAGILGLVFVIIAGIKFVTASGDPKKVASATSTITYAIIGLAVATLAFIIVQMVQTFFGSHIPIN